MEKWIKEHLSSILDFEVPDDMIKYITSIKDSEAFDEYFASLLSHDLPEHQLFMADCKRRLFNSSQAANKKSLHTNNNNQATKKATVQDSSSSSSTAPQGGGKKKKNKFVPLFSSDGIVPNTILLKGRRRCNCEATEHKLINNCLSCGRIVCEQEGSGPCLFCGELVCTYDEMELIKSSGKKGEQLKKSLLEKGGEQERDKAVADRDRLLDYDRNSVRRTQVIDDEMDYFDENSAWLSDADREKFQSLKEEMHQLKHRGHLERKVRMDLFGREIVEDILPEGYEERVRKEITDSLTQSQGWQNRELNNPVPYFANTDISIPKLVYTPTLNLDIKSLNLPDLPDTNRVQDKELMEMQDLRRCLSMHQPYASLLVTGIKKHEGRSWYTSHRGRLWIASTVKVPSQIEIDEVQGFYKKLYNDDSIQFPSQYQSGCLLGCVNVDEVLSQEEYRRTYPDGESDSPFVFICTNPQMLPVVFPVKGSHKIYKLEPQIHKVASSALMRPQPSSTES